MDNWGRSNPGDRHNYVSSTNPQQQPFHLQEQSNTSPHHTIPPPAFVSNTPALWQLGRHSLYIPSTPHDQQLSTLSEKPILSYSEGDGNGQWDPERVQRQLNRFDEADLRDVEEELHRGLRARQVNCSRLGSMGVLIIRCLS
jgi:hypothetical protein